MTDNSSGPIRDPFAWRAALTPVSGNSPASTARTSRAGSFCSRTSTPRVEENVFAPPSMQNSDTPPSSGPSSPGRHSARSVGSVRSNVSSRSCGRTRAMPPTSAYPPSGMDYTARSASSGSGNGRGSVYATPNSSARMSEFGSVYDNASLCGSARMADLGSVQENEVQSPHYEVVERKVPSRKKQSAYAAAFDTFAPAANDSSQHEVAEISLDPRQVFSSARHGKHKEVEAALVAGFDPCSMDSFGNTLFHVACQNGNKRIAKAAIKYGGDMDAQNLKGNTGVHFLFAYGYADIGEYFIEKGASGSILNELGKNPRHGIK